MKIGGIIGGIVVLIILFVLGGAVYQVDETQRGVLLQNGAIASETPIKPGLNFKLPIVQDVDTINVQSQKEEFLDLTAQSADLQPATVTVSVNYRIAEDKVVDVRRTYLNEQNLIDRVLRPVVRDQVKTVFSKFTAEKAYQQREAVTAAFIEEINANIRGPIIIESIQVEDIKLSAAFVALLEDKAAQTLKVQTLAQIEQQQVVTARTTVINAKAEADANLARATAQAEAVRIQGQAEADAIRAKGEALIDNPNLVELTKAERWDGKLPTTVLPNGTIPFIDAVPAVGPTIQ